MQVSIWVAKREGNKFKVVVDGLRRLWVDMSIPLGIEAGHKNYALEDMAKVQGLFSTDGT